MSKNTLVFVSILLFLLAFSSIFLVSFTYAVHSKDSGSNKDSKQISLTKSIHSFDSSSSSGSSPTSLSTSLIEDKIKSKGKANVIVVFDSKEAANGNSVSSTNPVNSRSKVSRKSSSNKKSISNDESNNGLDDGSNNGYKNSDIMKNLSGFKHGKNLGIINAYSGELDANGLANLKKQGINFKIYEDKILQIHDIVNSDYSTSNNINSDNVILTSPLSVSTAAVNANYSWNVLNITGRNVTIAIIDTGVDYTHPALGGCFGNGTNNITNLSCRVVDGYDFYNNDSDPVDDHNHGTEVAGIIAANGAVIGVAPDALIYALKVCNAEGSSCPTSNIIEAINWATNNSHFAKIISLSLGGYASDTDEGNTGKDPLSLAIDEATILGSTVVISAGNDGSGVSTINTPAASKNAITVGASDDNETANVNDDRIWGGSSRGPSAFGRLDPDIVAPGVSIQSTTRFQSLADIGVGTSFAAPFVSGAAALLLEQNPSLTPSQIRAILMQSTQNISGKVFEKGAGQLDVMSALSTKMYALVNYTNPYHQNALSDRWEFVITPGFSNYANITLINNNNFDVVFNSSIDSIENLENNIILNSSQLQLPNNITVSANSNMTFQVNFTLNNFSDNYATTYGGVIVLPGYGNNGTDNITKMLRIPVVVTIPIMNHGYVNRTMFNYAPANSNEDVYYYCYYNPNSRNVSFTLDWSNSSYWINLYLYNSIGDFYNNSKTRYVNTQNVLTNETDSFKWVRIDGYQIFDATTFTLNISELANRAPTFNTITAIGGVNSNVASSFLVYRPDDIILNISYIDLDNESITLSVNDSSYTLINNCSSGFNSSCSSNYSSGYATYTKIYNSNITNDSIIVTLEDPYGSIVTRIVNITYINPLIIDSYLPITVNNNIYRNSSLTFVVNVNESVFGSNPQTIYYSWNVVGRVNNTYNETMITNDTSGLFTSNYLFNSSLFNASIYNVSVLVFIPNGTSQGVNKTLSWNVYVDENGPIINISSPQNSSIMIYNISKIDINYSLSDDYSAISSCYYDLNSSTNVSGFIVTNYSSHVILTSCANTSLYLANGEHLITIYSNDTMGNIGYFTINFSVNDITSPIIVINSPTGTLSYTTSVTLNVSTNEAASCKFDAMNVDYDSMNRTFSDNYTNHVAIYTVSNGNYNLYINCKDVSNNTNDNASTLLSFTVAEDSSHSGGSNNNRNSGSSSGGGGSIGSGNDTGFAAGGPGNSTGFGMGNYDGDAQQNITITPLSGVYNNLMSGKNISINNTDVPISKISLDTKELSAFKFFNISINNTINASNSNNTNISNNSMINISNLTISIIRINNFDILYENSYKDSLPYVYILVNISYNVLEGNVSRHVSDSKLSISALFYVDNLWIINNHITKDDVLLFKYNANSKLWVNLSMLVSNLPESNFDNNINNTNIDNDFNNSNNGSNTDNNTYYSASNLTSGMYVIVKNTFDSGLSSQSKSNKDDKLISNKSNVPKIHSSSKQLSNTEKLMNFQNGTANILNKAKQFITVLGVWIILSLLGIILLILITFLFINNRIAKHYKDQLIESNTIEIDKLEEMSSNSKNNKTGKIKK